VRDAYNILNDAIDHTYKNVLLNESKKDKDDDTINKNQSILNINHKSENIDDESSSNTGLKVQRVSEDEKKIIKSDNINVSEELENELKLVRNNKKKLFYNFETNCKVEYI
jgi:hypothetical protein